MKRRKFGHDYSSPCVYLITIATENRKPLLGDLVFDASTLQTSNPNCQVVYSPLGLEVKRVINNVDHFYPQIKVYKIEIMSDHIHFIIHVTERLPVHLSKVIAGLKTGINRSWRRLLNSEKVPFKLWEDGFCDKILIAGGLLNR